GGLAVLAITPQATTTLVTVPLAASATPTLLSVKGKTAYVAFTGGAQGAGVSSFTPGPKGKPPAAMTIFLPHAVASLAISGTMLYALLNDGSLGRIAFGQGYTGLKTPSSQLPIYDGTPESYSPSTPVPTVPLPSGTSTPTPP